MTETAKFDYIVVGSGAGGGTLAANLAIAGYKVLVLEAGKDHSENYYSQVPVFHSLSTEQDDLKWDFFVKHYSNEEQAQKDSKFNQPHKGILYPRAGTLGGCTAHNAMICVYPHNSDWDHIAEITGDKSWASNNMRKYFERLENCRYGVGNTFHKYAARLLRRIGISFNPRRRGYNGWLQTSNANPTLVLKDKSLIRIILEAFEQTIEERSGKFLRRLKRGFDPNDWDCAQNRAEGAAFFPINTAQGRRIGTRERLKAVRKKFPNNLTIWTDCLAKKVLFGPENTAIGVEYFEGEHLYKADPYAGKNNHSGITKQVFAKREVIISGGAFNTPQLLMLSGIGPAEQLRKHGIEVRVDLPGVGENLQDRYEVGVVSQMKRDFPLLKEAAFSPTLDDPNFVNWKKGKGLYTSNGGLLGIIKRSNRQKPDPDLYIFGLPGYFDGYKPGYSTDHIKNKNYFTWCVLKGHTNNLAGKVTLHSANPVDTPEINFRYFDDDPGVDQAQWQDDLDSVVAGVEFARRMNIDSGLRGVIDGEVVPGPKYQTQEEIRKFVKNEAWGHHASCSCKIGADGDKMAVLDSRFRVRRTRNLRVVDASVFPRIPGLFIVSSVYMIGEKASDVILEDAKKNALSGNLVFEPA
ncbi:glucose-methanol-choline oxidoreductase [Adhaeribacter arboris]|uniref:Glucose-methanol-choline oxidoreductase n=1 Tax=Adhaeribacter arboris TaxID=2072846 RepID=A0A2T2YLU1_9BACT|nr:GMC oxidoreductase [Adhaeribacter arboris]PSR56481.1 glucose-methanol-choline oxidoreductase [Adhaeribacter arboris]